MNFKKVIPLSFVLIFNLWLIKVFQFSPVIGITVVLTSVFLYAKKFVLLLPLLVLLMFFQYKTSSIIPLTYLNEVEKSVQIQKMHAYPPRLYRFANWLEARPETISFYKIQTNISEVVNPNLYFFANHPRERGGVVEFEKFPYILLPFFVFGIFLTWKTDLLYLFLSLTPLILISLIGNSNQLGPFSLFPFLATNIAGGLESVFVNKTKLMVFLIIFSLVFMQTITYASL